MGYYPFVAIRIYNPLKMDFSPQKYPLSYLFTLMCHCSFSCCPVCEVLLFKTNENATTRCTSGFTEKPVFYYYYYYYFEMGKKTVFVCVCDKGGQFFFSCYQFKYLRKPDRKSAA